MKNKRDRLFFTLLFVPQAPQSSYDRRAELEVLLAIPSAQSACGMEITMTDRHPYYEFEKDTYEIDEFDCSSIFLFVGKERALLLDTGCGIGDLKGVIRKITDKPYIVIASHGHMDHIGGAGAFDELYINPADNYFLDVSFEKMLESRRNYADFIRTREDKYYPYSTEKDMLCWEKKPKLLPLSDGQTFDLGGRIITAYSCPGHTPGEMIFIDSKTRYLFCADAFALLKTRHFFIFSLCAMLISVPLGTYYAYTASYLADAGIADVSTAMSFGQMSEIFFMLVIPLLFRRLGVKYMLLIGMLAWFVRYAFFALGVSEEGRFLLYLGILLHGVCYDFFFVVGFIYTDRVAGEKVKGQAQSMIVMFTYGIGMLLGSQISGALYNRLVAGQTVPQAWVTFWWIPAVAAAVIALIFLFSFKYDDDKA